MTAGRTAVQRALPLGLMAASGFAGLGYQIVWTEQCSLALGHESAAVLAVVTAFFGGLGLGGLVLGAPIERSARPLRWYAACEFVVAAWSLTLSFVAPAFHDLLGRAIGLQASPARQWLLAFLGTFGLFLPATAAMGAALPAMERLTHEVERRGRSIAGLYGANTFGAVLGVLVAAFWWVPALGLRRTAAACSALNLACAVLALAVLPNTALPAAPTPTDLRARHVLVKLAVTGFLGIGYEVLVVRVLSEVTQDTVYSFALLLAVYLLGSALGATAYRRWLEPHANVELLERRLLGALAASCLLGTAALYGAEVLRKFALETFGSGMPAALAGEALLALSAFGPATLVMGALFSHLARAASGAGLPFGRAAGVNMLVAAAAPAALGVVALPALGAKIALTVLVLGYVSLAAPAWSSPWIWAPALGALGVALGAPPLRFVDVPEGGRVASYEEGALAAVSVVEDADGVARLRIDNRQQEGSSASRYVDARQAWLPLLLHPSPRSALFLGLGTGVTASAAAADPTLDVDAVELLPEVIAASAHFALPANGRGSSHLHVIAADARRFVRRAPGRYDVIVSDNFHPARSGSGALYTVEHFAAVGRRLQTGGIFCQWLPLHQLDLATLQSIVRSFVTAYPRSYGILANNSLETPVLGLVARVDQARFELGALHRRFENPALPAHVTGLGLEDELAVLGSFVAGPASLEAFAAGAPANTDDRPVVAYRAPRVTYAPAETPGERLFSWLNAVSISPAELLAPPANSEASARLFAYWSARNRFIVAGRDVRPSASVTGMLAQVEGPLLTVLRISPDFRPAYDPLLSMASSLARSDVSGARTLLTALTQIQPARTEASQLLAALSSAPETTDATRR